jgi:O-methyltransferase
VYSLIIYGIGSGCKDFLEYTRMSEGIEIVAYVDSNETKIGTTYNDKAVDSPSRISNYEYDYIVITARDSDEIEENLVKNGIERRCIIKFLPQYSKLLNENVNKDFSILQKILMLSSIDRLYVCNMQNLGRKRRMFFDDSCLDYVRYSSLELVADEIYRKGLQGCIAELGVYKGEFARKINDLFYDRKFYLFDTFEGFNCNDMKHELISEFSASDKYDFADTNEDLVLSKMKYPNNCIIKKGYFPDTASEVNDKFVFVSIDADLYKPIYEGLKYFYPRTVTNGYIFIHDYNSIRFKGAKEAVLDYCTEMGINFFPLSDMSGTAVISK